MRKIWFVMPVYFDVESFLELRVHILSKYQKVEFVVLDDSAGDDPQVLHLKSLDDITVIVPPFNLGHQRGIVYALRAITSRVKKNDSIVTMDSDGEDRPEDIPKILEGLENEKGFSHSIVLIQRTRRRESLFFKFFYFFYKVVFRSLTGTVIRSGNFAGFHGSFLKNYIKHPYFDLCYSSTLISLKVKKTFILCPRGERIKGQSKMNFTSLIMHGIRMLMPFIDQIAIRSLIAFASLFVSSMIFSCTIIGIKFFTEAAIPGWASYTLMLSLLMSFVALGNFLVLFSVFSQSQGLAMSRLEENIDVKNHSEKDVSLLKSS